MTDTDQPRILRTPAVAPTIRTAETAVSGALWRNADFLKFWSGETLSLFGTQITMLALPLTAVLMFNAGPAQMGLLLFLQLVPHLAFAMLFGVWVDRARRRPIMIGANVARMILIGLVPTLAAFGQLQMPLLFVIAFGIGVASVLFDVSWMSYVPTLVRDPQYLVDANSKLSITATASYTAGPAIAGLLITALTAPVAMAVDAFSYLVSVVSLLRIRVSEPRTEPSPLKRRLIPELLEGLHWVFGDKYLRPVAFVGCFCNFVLMGNSSIFLLYAVRDKAVQPEVLGLILSVGAIGGLLGSIASGRLVRHVRLGLVYSVSVTAVFLGPILIPAAGGPTLLVVAMFIASFFLSYLGLAVSNVVIMSLRQTVTPPKLMGRMNAAMRTLLFGGGSLGGLVAGLLGDNLGLHQTLWVIASGAALMIPFIVLSPVGRLREMPAPADREGDVPR